MSDYLTVAEALARILDGLAPLETELVRCIKRVGGRWRAISRRY